ncbi:succinate dehydrogenase cytochrome b subunit [Bacteriovorax sp. Seq25_V]|uniref:succinate dehydrogenase cytochrome b subunit n=1 Tax=Bacteriovorax sp. Seq25_V TaxID=1201288 RepID=UPI000389E03C|nr:succinate dehydrogenase cytochrome b subunit [Bacteriovorax sp. Seq25_V]EQC43894.1 succinate dehydrogenase cytochrome B subunit, b558 family [Bacteriovorax sp. Seq25_V]
MSLRFYLNSSVMKKQVMGITGLMLCGFLLSHLAGNCLIYVGSDAFNKYAHALITNPLIYVAEFILASIFLTHIGLALKLTIENKAARPQNYYIKQKTGRGATFASSTMPYTGIIILAFLVFHLINFKFGPVYTATVGGVEMRDLYKTVVEYFISPVNVAWYIFCMIALGIHVSHGFWSAFQSIGFNHPKYNCLIKCASKAFGVLVTLGYSALPIFCHLQGVK